MTSIDLAPFLMFTGSAEEALQLYVSIVPNSRIISLVYWNENETGQVGKVKLAEVDLAGVRVKASDSLPVHKFTFTPSLSLFVSCEIRGEFDSIVEKLGEGGSMLMPPNDYGFSKRFCWLNDRFGVSWQVNLK